jgi:serine/threonine protein kinase
MEDQEEEVLETIMINREYLSLADLDHPSISELLEVYKEPEWIYFVSPLYKGGEVCDLIEISKRGEILPMPEEELKPLIYQMIRALRYLGHMNIVHRDLKPQNMMLKYALECPNKIGNMKLIDFGFSLDLEANMDPEEQELIG